MRRKLGSYVLQTLEKMNVKFLVNQKDKVVYDEKLNGIHMIMISNLNQ